MMSSLTCMLWATASERTACKTPPWQRRRWHRLYYCYEGDRAAAACSGAPPDPMLRSPWVADAHVRFRRIFYFAAFTCGISDVSIRSYRRVVVHRTPPRCPAAWLIGMKAAHSSGTNLLVVLLALVSIAEGWGAFKVHRLSRNRVRYE